MNIEIKIPIRNLVEYVFSSGDLDMCAFATDRALEGTKAHKKIQKQNIAAASAEEEYISEVSLTYKIEREEFLLIIDGRADGIIKKNGKVTIEEIKSTYAVLEHIDDSYNITHWAQAKCYAYIYAIQNCIEDIGVQLTYYNLNTEETKCIIKQFNIDELSKFFHELIEKYIAWQKLIWDMRRRRDASIKSCVFPYGSYREGQREFAVAVYKTITEGKTIFVQAPTGIGKTISALFPAIKAMGEGYTSKIFYLTARTTHRQIAEEALLRMIGQGLEFKSITLTAKDKICYKEQTICRSYYCEYAQGYYDKINVALMDVLINENVITREIVEKYAAKHKLCPFEFSLDVSLYTDCIICDYNYVFDPIVYLRRYFNERYSKNDYILLIDEAHNLSERSRQMFSAELGKKAFLELKRLTKSSLPDISKSLNNLNSYMLKLKKACGDSSFLIQKEAPEEIYHLLKQFINDIEACMSSSDTSSLVSGELLDLYFHVITFMKISDFYDEKYVTYIEKNRKDTILKLFCLDPSFLLGKMLERVKATAFFSATLTPIEYYREILGGSSEDYLMRLASPFDKQKLGLFIGGKISTRFKARDKSYQQIAEYIHSIAAKRIGNYIAFFPSYKYMLEVYNVFSEAYPDFNTLIQTSSMSEEERLCFLNEFKSDNIESLVGFAVMGGVFSEGIDLPGERLVGVIIVGVGLPQLCLERDIIMDYYQNKNSRGFEYAYMYPGMSKVQQAAGRVIRTESDKGVVLLLDERFLHSNYQRIFPKEWQHYIKVDNTDELIRHVEAFWYEINI